jgi:SPP1 gp7 family putative phage head morphogenesis protein
MFDSVFLPYVSHYAETPEISIATIEQSLDPIERRTVRALNRAIEDGINELVTRAESFLVSGDAAAIASLSWLLQRNLQLPLVAEWEQGFLIGGDDGIDEIKASFPSGTFNLEALAQTVLALVPVSIQNTPAEQAVLQRTNRIAGDFSDDILARLKTDLIAAIIAPEGEQFPISRKELSARIQKTLDVSASRSEAIARTELTAAYNQGRLNTYGESNLVTHVRFVAIGDDRTTPICLSRNGLVFEKGSAEVTGNTPPLHVRCRSVLSPLMPRVNKRHAEMIADPSRNPNNRELVPLSKGWKVDAPQG